jgi:NADH-quinone oxidoreductase subunit M
MKKMIAYSSIAHMGYVTASIFSINSLSVKAAVFQMISHGLIAAALFFSVGMLDKRMQTKYISNYGGVASSIPNFAIFFMFFTLASIGLPGTSGFIGEFLALNCLFAKHHIMAAISCFGVLLSTIYMLGLYKAVMLGKIENQKVALLSDLKPYEALIFGSLSISILLLGIFPDIINNFIVI